MRTFQPSGQSSGQDAKSKVSPEALAEMAKHLRQLSFYFLLVCAGLVLAIYLPRDTKLDKATAQLNEVIRFQSDVGDVPLWEVAGAAPPKWAGPREPQAAILFQKPNDDKQSVCFVFENEILQGQWMVLGKQGLTDFRQVETHEEFAQLWNSLARDDAYLRISEYAPTANYSLPGDGGVMIPQSTPVNVVTDPEKVQRLHQLAYSAAGSNQWIPTEAKWVVLDEDPGGGRYTQGIQLARSMAMVGGHDSIVLPVAMEPARLPILRRLLDRTDTKFEYLAANHYDLVHRELSDWTLGSKVDQLGLYTMRSILDELRVSQSEKFEVFGFGVPYEFLFQYGLLVLVAVELFFWGHLRSFRIIAARHEPTVWAPWLPLYPDRLSRLLAIMSTVLFPLLVIVRLVAVAETRLFSISIGTLGIAVACAILIEFWRHWQLSSTSTVENTVAKAA